MKKLFFLSIILLLVLHIAALETRFLSVVKPQAIADLRTNEGEALVNAKWFVQPANITEANFRSMGAGATVSMLLYPTGIVIKTHVLHPQIGATDLDGGITPI